MLDDLDDHDRALLRQAPAPTTARAMAATLTDDRFSDPGWIFERKLDGIRCVAVRDGGPTRLLSRNDKALDFPEVAAALDAQARTRFAVDGELVAFDGAQTSFALLAQRHQREVPVFLHLFDVLWLDGCDVRALPLRRRKALLRDAIDADGPLRLTAHRDAEGEALYEEACRKGWEGVIAKRADSPYASRRSRDWLKFKCSLAQELVIGGFTAPQRSRTDFGALLVGYHQDGELRYAGKVGTGFTQQTLADLGGRLRADKAPADVVRE